MPDPCDGQAQRLADHLRRVAPTGNRPAGHSTCVARTRAARPTRDQLPDPGAAVDRAGAQTPTATAAPSNQDTRAAGSQRSLDALGDRDLKHR